MGVPDRWLLYLCNQIKLAGSVAEKGFPMNTIDQNQRDVEDFANDQANPRASVSLVPMLVAGVVLTFGGMIAALVFTSVT
jgi:hypothetical protein